MNKKSSLNKREYAWCPPVGQENQNYLSPLFLVEEVCVLKILRIVKIQDLPPYLAIGIAKGIERRACLRWI